MNALGMCHHTCLIVYLCHHRLFFKFDSFYRNEHVLTLFLHLRRMVTGLLKTAQGVPPGVATTLLPPQESTMKLEAMKCLVEILKSMGDWMNKQLRIPDPHSLKTFEALEDNDSGMDNHVANSNIDEIADGPESQSDTTNGVSDAASLEQRRAYKLELQVRDSVIFSSYFDSHNIMTMKTQLTLMF